MATILFAYSSEIKLHRRDSSLSPANLFTFSVPTMYWRNVDGVITVREFRVPVTFDITLGLAAIQTAIASAIVAAALSEFGWVIPSANVIFPQFRRG